MFTVYNFNSVRKLIMACRLISLELIEVNLILGSLIFKN